jgi:hypothetical protein
MEMLVLLREASAGRPAGLCVSQVSTLFDEAIYGCVLLKSIPVSNLVGSLNFQSREISTKPQLTYNGIEIFSSESKKQYAVKVF